MGTSPSCFSLAKVGVKAPQAIASGYVENRYHWLWKVAATGPYISFFLDKLPFPTILEDNDCWRRTSGQQDIGHGQMSPWTCQPKHCKTLLSWAFALNGYRWCSCQYSTLNWASRPSRINHLGDWGKQFGMLIVAYKLWGDKTAVEADPIQNSSNSMSASAEADEKPELDEQSPQWFKKTGRWRPKKPWNCGNGSAMKVWLSSTPSMINWMFPLRKTRLPWLDSLLQ